MRDVVGPLLRRLEARGDQAALRFAILAGDGGKGIRITIAVGIVTALSMTLSIKTFEINSYKVPLPYPDPLNNIAIQVMFNMRENLLPKNVTLIQVAPGQAFFAQIYVAALLGIILTMPVIVRELATFVGPGLYQQEKTIIRKTTSISIGLFAIGCLFSYFLVIPYVLDFLYRYGETIGISAFLRHIGICSIYNAVHDRVWTFIPASNNNVGLLRCLG